MRGYQTDESNTREEALPESMIEDFKLAHKRDVPYQSLLKVFLAERIEEEFKRHHHKMAKA